MDQFIDKVSTPIRRFLSRGLSLPTLSTFSRTPSSVNGGDQTPLPSAGKRQREESEEEGEEGPMKRVKMDIDEPSPVTAPDAAPSREESATVETIRPGVEGLSLAPGTPPPSNGRTRSAQSSPDSKKTRYQRGLRGTRKSAAADTPSPSKARLGPKRQCALLISFCGSGYSGMQIQKDAKTIEGALFNALVKVGSVSEDNSDDPAKVNIQRAARTDAGVHAARNLVSIKAIMELPGVTDLVGLLNKHLPEEIYVWDIVRTQNSFNARTSCDSRKYTYFMPTYMLLPPAPASLTANALLDVEEGAYDVAKHPFWKSVANQPITPESTLFMLRKKWRIDEETVSRFRAVLQEYIGTHNFWNFTIGREFKEAAAHRHMKSIEVSDPAIYGETEWLSVQIHGQSFMLHQIRKMITAAAFVVRSQGSPSLIPDLYESARVRIPKAPALGLLLEEPVYESYNQKIEVANVKWKDVAASSSKGQEEDGEHQANFIRDPMNFEKHKKEIEEFKKEHIYAEMQRTEEEQGTFDAWLSSVDQAEARLFYDLRGLPVPSELNIQVKAGSTRSSAVKDDGDESDDALGKGKINFKNVDLEG